MDLDRFIAVLAPLFVALSCSGSDGDSGLDLPTWPTDAAIDAAPESTIQTDLGADACVPDCEGRDCGEDGCGGSCGSCFGDLTCNWDTGTCEAVCTDSFEPDDDEGASNLLGAGTAQDHVLCPETDEDWYRIDLDEKSALTVTVTASSQAAIDVYLIDESHADLDSTSTIGGTAVLKKTMLQAGAYFVRVDKGDDTEPNPQYGIAYETACAPDCTGIQCGEDGCGGLCNNCPEGFECVPGEGCVTGCADDSEPDDDPAFSNTLLPDTPRTQTLCPANDTDWFSFDLPEPSNIKVWVTTQAQYQVDVYLYDEDLAEIESAMSDTGYANINPPTLDEGRYFLRLSATDGEVQVPSYKVEFGLKCAPSCEGKECGDDGCGGSCGECGAYLTCGEGGLCESTCVDATDADGTDDDHAHANALPVQSSDSTHSLCPGDDVDWFRFSLGWNLADVTIETFGAFGNTEMWLYDADLNEIDSDDDSGVGQFSRLNLPDVPSGTYYVRLQSFDDDEQIPQYTISLKATCSPSCEGRVCGGDGCSPGSPCGTCDFGYVCTAEGQCASGCIDQVDKTGPDNDPVSANVLFDGETIFTHSICPATDVDWYVFTVTQKSDVDVEIVTLSGTLDGWLFDSGLAEIDSNTTKPSGKAKLHGGALAEGLYYVRVASGEGEQIPVYTISLDQSSGGF